MEHCCCAVGGTIEWVNESRTEDVVQIDMGQLRGVGEWWKSVWCVMHACCEGRGERIVVEEQ